MRSAENAHSLLVAALAQGLPYEKAGQLAGISKATVARRMADSTFRAQVDELRAAHVRRVELRLGELSGRALDALEALLADRDSPAQRLGAARAILDGLLRFREAGEVERRLLELEARIAPPAAMVNGRQALQ
jgi:hypothetical protein